MSDFVRLETDVVDEIVRICNVMLVEFHQSKAATDSLLFVDGFGDFDSAQQHAAGYRRKDEGTPKTARERVDQFIDAHTRLRDAIATGGEAVLEPE